MKQDRAFQGKLLDELRVEMKSHRAVLAQAATGAGKTYMATLVAKGVRAKKKRSWFICHRDFLLEQTSNTFTAAGLDHGFIAAGEPYNPYFETHICSVDTLKRRLDNPNIIFPDVIQWDECHHIGAGGWSAVMNAAKHARHVGWTATPERLDGRGLDDHFTSMVQGPPPSWLIEQGYLSKYKAYAPGQIDLTNVRMTAGDFNAADLAGVMESNEIVGDFVRHYRERAWGMRGIYFAPTIALSQKWAAMFTAAGIPAIHLDGSMSKTDRKLAAMAMARGDIWLIFNVALFGEGYDLSAQAGTDVTIDVVGLLRRTQSVSLHYQQIGRALRPRAGKEYAVMLDHVGNIAQHGLPDLDREWSLEGTADKKKAGGSLGPPTWQCKTCFLSSSVTAPYCANGHPRPPIEVTEIQEIEAELNEISAEDIKLARKNEERACKSLADYLTLAVKRGYNKPEKWAGIQWSYKKRALDQAQARAEQQFNFYRR